MGKIFHITNKNASLPVFKRISCLEKSCLMLESWKSDCKSFHELGMEWINIILQQWVIRWGRVDLNLYKKHYIITLRCDLKLDTASPVSLLLASLISLYLISPQYISLASHKSLTSWYLHRSGVSCSSTPLSRTRWRSCHRVLWPGVGTGLLLGAPFPVAVPAPTPVPVPVPVPAPERRPVQSIA